MRPLVAATVTLDDLKNYFKGEHWRTAIREDGALEGRSDSYLIEIAPGGGPEFAVEVYAYEDESDRDEAVTDNPMGFLVDFLKTGTAGDEALQKMAGLFGKMANLPPDGMANLLRIWASEVEAERIGPRALGRILRRACLMVDMSDHISILKTTIKLAAREEIETKEMEDLAKKMKEKGWRVKEGQNDRGYPELTVDIAGVYEAKLEIDHMPWKYSFEVHNHPDTKIEGVTDDPIGEFRSYYKSDKVQTAKSELKHKVKTTPKSPEAEGTVAPQKKKPPEHFDDYESGGPA